ncbi:MAG: substrate-binding domain-containing protein [Lachnospiraceae bacterium]|nr:substrate-binding domain-containing protein [Lachnospiraceae bacterium]
MKRYGRLGCLLAFCIVLGSTGCGNSQNPEAKTVVEGLDKLGNVQVIAREEGSGTRGAFAQLVGLEEGTKDLTTTDAKVTEDSDSMIQAVAGNPSAIGYVSEGLLTVDGQVKKLFINGVSPEEAGGKYPLTRSFYLAYSGTLSATAQDFLSYVHTEGQKIVDSSYTAVAKSSSFLSDQSVGTVTIQGSTSVEPLMQELADAYMALNTNADIQITVSDSTAGLNAAMAGSCDLGMASRDLKDYEKELLNYEKIAEDNIAVIVAAGNPLENIELTVLEKIYTGKLTAWDAPEISGKNLAV